MPAFGGQFTVTEQLTNVKSFQNIDGSVTVAFRVSYTDLLTNDPVRNVVPTLTVPDCAAFGGEVVFNTTYLGRGFPNPTIGAVPTWNNNATQDLVFNIHMFNNSTFCPLNNETPINLDEVCRTFTLSFTHFDQRSPVEALDPNNLLLFENPVTDGFKIIHTLSATNPARIQEQGNCGLYTTNATIQIPVNRFTPNASIVNDPNNRILWGIDWNLNTNNQSVPVDYRIGIGNLLFPIGNLSYNLWQHFLLPSDNVPMIYDEMPQSIVDQNGTNLVLGPLGGNGESNAEDCDLETWNFLDLTGVTVEGTPIRQQIINGTLALTLNIDRGGTFISFREAMLVVATENRCEFGDAFGMGPTESQFKFASVNDTGGGLVTVTLAVPDAWKNATNGGQLSSDYTIDWYYHNATSLAEANLVDDSAANARNLTQTLSLPGNAGDFGYQARITHSASGSVVTVDVPADAFSYGDLDRPSIVNAEAFPDEYLDAGETLVMPFTLLNGLEETVNVEVVFGVTEGNHSMVFDANFGDNRTQISSNRFSLSDAVLGGQSFGGDLQATLAATTVVCEPITFFVETHYTLNGVTYSTRRTFSEEANCLLDNSVFEIGTDYTAKELFGVPDPCANSNCTETNCGETDDCPPPPGVGWQFESGKWVGKTADIAVFQTLTSPVYPVVNTGASISLNHQANLSLLAAGGILEYRTRADAESDWSDWFDLILPLETALETPLYNTRRFGTLNPPNDQIIAGRLVFMRQLQPQSIVADLPESVLSGSQISFRFTFQQNVSGDLGQWTINDFTYATTAAADNEFNPTIAPIFNIGPCTPDLSIAVNSNENLTFQWFNNFQSLVNGTPAATTTSPTWVNVSKTESGSAFVMVKADNQQVETTTRIFELNVTVNGGVPPFGALRNAWLQTVDTPGAELDIVADGQVNVLDMTLQVTATDCEI
ncbi:hypothetical protein [Acanthopleuribacter pedis]|uniref:Uncharacterized protein n=1 Tax=Acanthopleuribacter pedis TaxID=442870 RepID=A0A8J7QKT5_9BACT|nr:hypothetical protein [Acanthopleuribacter pedis]MBO1320063.1 hypothetical protein [Acanthopleuribacter pedis]